MRRPAPACVIITWAPNTSFQFFLYSLHSKATLCTSHALSFAAKPQVNLRTPWLGPSKSSMAWGGQSSTLAALKPLLTSKALLVGARQR